MGRIAGVVVAGALALVAAQAAPASPQLRLGIVEHAGAYWAEPGFYPTLRELGTGLLRVNLNWGGRLGVARRRPQRPTSPNDPAYDWRLYDRLVLESAGVGVELVFSIFGTPAYANGGRPPTRAPTDPDTLRDFAYAAATRYSGRFRRRDGRVLPPVRLWTAWNEPNLRLGLIPQYRRLNGRWVIASAVEYARICDAVYRGVHATGLRGRRVACGVTAPRGNNSPTSAKPSISPLAFMRAFRKAGRVPFDAYAHHAYYGAPSETPSTRPRGRTAVTLGNIDVLVREVTRLFGRKRIWITEYGYQTNPPDRIFGVSYARQARHLEQAYRIARRHPRIDLLLWFLLRDEPRLAGWQSGLITARGQRKPAFAVFQRLAAPAR
jgi:Glycosyl hydrolase catalytic core